LLALLHSVVGCSPFFALSISSLFLTLLHSILLA
jgi:hypothetical protein